MDTSDNGERQEVNPEELTQYLSLIQQQMRLFEGRLNAQEQMIAQLSIAFSEVWAGMEASLEMALNDKPEAEKKLFYESVNRFRSEIWKAMNEQVKGMAGHATGTSGAVEDMVSEGDETSATSE